MKKEAWKMRQSVRNAYRYFSKTYRMKNRSNVTNELLRISPVGKERIVQALRHDNGLVPHPFRFAEQTEGMFENPFISAAYNSPAAPQRAFPRPRVCYTSAMRFLLMFALLIFPPVAFAQQAPAIAKAGAGPVNQEGARIIALTVQPGTLGRSEIMKTNGAPVYQFEVTREDGSLMFVGIDGATGKVVEHTMRKLGKNAALPPAKVTQEKAEEKAVKYVDEKVFGTEKPVVKKFQYTQEDGRPIYLIVVTKFFKTYNIIIDPFTGEMLAARKET
jgi:uncharacterized membrane protein YkoI